MPYNVMIVDDEPMIRFGLSSCIEWEREGLALVGEAANGEAALALIRELGVGIDILITDIKMPLMDGLELVKEVKALMPAVKAVLVSSYSDFEYAREAVKLGVVVDYLMKPTMEPSDLARILHVCKERLDEDRARSANADWIAHEERKRRLHRFETTLKSYLNGAEASFEWKPEWANGQLALAVWKHDRSAGREAALRRIVTLEAAAAKLNEWCGDGLALLAGDDEVVVLAAERSGSAWNAMQACHRRLLHEEGVCFTVGVSPSFSSLTTIRQAYGWAAKALEQSFYHGRGQCYLGAIPPAAAEKQTSQTAGWKAVRLREQFSQAFATAERERCQSILAQYDALWREERRFNRADIIAQARTLLGIMWAQPIRMNAEETMRSMTVKLAEVENVQTLRELSAFVLRECDRLWEPDNLRIAVDDSGGAHVIQLALSYIQENYRRELSLREVADYVHMSKNYFSEQFKRRTGLNFIDYVIRLRIHYAKHLLEHTGMRVQDVGLESGFNSPKHFLKLFKRLTGCTPAEYREKQSNARDASTGDQGGDH